MMVYLPKIKKRREIKTKEERKKMNITNKNMKTKSNTAFKLKKLKTLRRYERSGKPIIRARASYMDYNLYNC